MLARRNAMQRRSMHTLSGLISLRPFSSSAKSQHDVSLALILSTHLSLGRAPRFKACRHG